MQTVILFPATPEQLRALHAWHLTQQAATTDEAVKYAHAAHARDIHRRLRDCAQRTEDAPR